MKSWAQVVKATAHIPISPPAAPLVPKPKREVLRLSGKEYAVYKAKKQRMKTKKEEEERKKYWDAEKASEEFWLKQEEEHYYISKLDEYFPEDFAEYTKSKKVESAKELFYKLMKDKCEEEEYKLMLDGAFPNMCAD
jgi:hypothetical protein